MDVVVLAAVLGSALLHAAWNALLKREREPVAAAAGVFAVAGSAALVAALVENRWFPEARALVWSVGAGVFEAGYILSLSRALTLAPLGPVYTVSRGGALVGVWPISIVFLGERATALGLTGAAVVLGGLVLTGVGQDRTAGRTDPRGLLWAVLTACNITGYHICYKEALADGGAAAAIFAVSIGTAIPINLQRIGAAGRRSLTAALRAKPVPIIVIGLLCCASFLIFLIGLARAGAGAVLTLRNTSVLFAQVLALALGERPTRVRLAGALAVAAGAVFLGWPT